MKRLIMVAGVIMFAGSVAACTVPPPPPGFDQQPPPETTPTTEASIPAGCAVTPCRTTDGNPPLTNEAPGPWVPALVEPQPAKVVTMTGNVPKSPDGIDGYVCWSEHGQPLPQPKDQPFCPHNWGGRPPENPTPIGTPPRLT